MWGHAQTQNLPHIMSAVNSKNHAPIDPRTDPPPNTPTTPINLPHAAFRRKADGSNAGMVQFIHVHAWPSLLGGSSRSMYPIAAEGPTEPATHSGYACKSANRHFQCKRQLRAVELE